MKSANQNDQNKRDEEEVDPDADYLGNIWGWKFSYIGLAIILFFLILAIVRSHMLGVPLTPTEDIEILNTNNPHIKSTN